MWTARLEHDRVAARRAVLRAILARYAGCDPGRVELRVAPGGKPELVLASGVTPIEFNCSSSGELAVYAVARDRRVGLDVERLRPVHDPLELARAVLHENDRTMLAGLPEDRRHGAFLERWTETEAYLKARGDGLGGLGGPKAADLTWSIRRLPLGDEYVGAVAAEGVGWRLCCRRW